MTRKARQKGSLRIKENVCNYSCSPPLGELEGVSFIPHHPKNHHPNQKPFAIYIQKPILQAMSSYTSKWAVVFGVLVSAFIGSTVFAEEKQMTVDEAISFALQGLKMTPEDIAPQNTILVDTFRLDVVNRGMASPVGLPEMCDELVVGFESANSIDSLLHVCQGLMGFSTEKPVFEKAEKDNPWNDVRELPPSIRDGMDIVMHLYGQAQEEIKLAFADIDTFQMDTIRTMPAEYLVGLSQKILAEADEGTIDDSFLAELDKEKKDKRFFALSAKVDRQKLYNSSIIVLVAAEKMLINAKKAASKNGVNPFLFAPDSMITGDILYYAETEFGPFAVGGFGKTTYLGDFALTVDLGGDDVYLGRVGSSGADGGFSIAIDLSGDDKYLNHKDFSFASGFLGTGFLIDLKGNDTYETGNFGLGSGIFGTGILLDYVGNDSYTGCIGTQGAGFMGIGILRDKAGVDNYLCQYSGQGFAYVGGLGLLFDELGDDVYVSQGSQGVNFQGHGLSMAQGFSIGHRPIVSGGIGIVLDKAGNDVYVSNIFGQGSAYWFGLGLLADRAGNDKYSAHQFAQGASAHLAIGIITDYDGTDSYLSSTVSQGLGHDLSIGLLDDRGLSSDSYLIWDLSQGAGNANGIGMFIDRGGDDGYLVRRDYNTQGYGNWRREFGSVGIFLDLGGLDSYSGRGQNKEIWTNGRYGIGIDFVDKKIE